MISVHEANAKQCNTYIAPQAAIAAAAALWCHRHSGRIANRPQTKLAPTDFDMQPNNHSQPWFAV